MFNSYNENEALLNLTPEELTALKSLSKNKMLIIQKLAKVTLLLLLTKTIISKNCEISHLNLGISSFQTEDKQLNFIVNVEKHITDLVKGTVMQI